ncbi:MAG: hypothetical protein ACMUIL_02310 [bacterium]
MRNEWYDSQRDSYGDAAKGDISSWVWSMRRKGEIVAQYYITMQKAFPAAEVHPVHEIRS